MGLHIIRQDSVKDRKKVTMEELQAENKRLLLRVKALEDQASAAQESDRVLDVLLGGGEA